MQKMKIIPQMIDKLDYDCYLESSFRESHFCMCCSCAIPHDDWCSIDELSKFFDEAYLELF